MSPMKIQSHDDYIHQMKRKRTKLIIYRVILFVAFLGLWELAANQNWIDSFFFSSPSRIISYLIYHLSFSELGYHIGITLLETLFSFVLILFISCILASFFWYFPSLGKIFEPALVMLNSLPKSALAPLLIVWLGTGIKTIVICGISVGVFGCILNLYQSFQNTDPERMKLIITFSGSRVQVFTKIIFPSNIASLVSLAKVNIGLSLVGVIIGEFLAGRRGLGYLIIYGSQVYQLDLVILSIFILCIIAAFIYQLISIIEKKLCSYFTDT